MAKNEEQKLNKKWEKAKLSNNFIFYKVMRHHQEECKKLLEMLLNIKIKEMNMSNEETIDLDHDKKGIRLDIFVKEKNRMHDIELQVVNKKELPKRARYYAGLMALDSLTEGEAYSKLCDSHVIFICMKDFFKKDLPVYSFENFCKEDKTIKLNDRDFKHFFIAPNCAKMIKDSELKAFFEFLVSGIPSNKFTSNLKDYVDDAKHNMQWRQQYMTYLRQRNYDIEEGLKKGIRIGKREGAQQKAIENAKNCLAYGDSPEKVSRCIGLPLEKVLELQKEIQAGA